MADADSLPGEAITADTLQAIWHRDGERSVSAYPEKAAQRQTEHNSMDEQIAS